MAKLQKIEGEILLPEAIIQHILSFLNGKEAARTTLLSKAWYNAWLTLPNVEFDFNERDFGTARAFVMFAKKTIERYRRLNLHIESLGLWMRDACHGNEALGIRSLSDIESYSLILPHEVPQHENLIRLSVSGCKIHRGKVPCITLFRTLPLSLSIEFGEQNLGPIVDSTINPWYSFHKLECLFLRNLDFESSFFHDFSSKFPSLKDLSLHGCSGFKSIQIYSISLESISLMEMNLRWAKLDVPNLHKFALAASNFPCLCFISSMAWESNISISYIRPVDYWFLKLKRFLRRLWLSKISLSLKFLERRDDDTGLHLLPAPNYDRDIQVLPQPSVETLVLSVHEPSLELLDGLFWSCRPKFITSYPPMSGTRLRGEANKALLEFLWKTLAPKSSENCCITNRNMPSMQDLVEANVEIFEESLAEWRSLAWKTLWDASTSPIDKHEIRFQLKWGAEPSAFT